MGKSRFKFHEEHYPYFITQAESYGTRSIYRFKDEG
jgi:hypothetical protein